MKPTDFVLALIDASKGTIPGRTLLQKQALFVSILSGLELDLEFKPHYYGPYSSTLEAALAKVKSLGFVEETSTGYGTDASGFEVRRHDFRLTPDGWKIAESLRQKESYQRVAESLQRIRDAGDPNYFELAIAGKALFVLKKKGKPMNRSEIVKEAGTFDWKIDPKQVEKAVSFLERIGLTQAK